MSCIQWLSSNRFILDKSVTFMFYCPQKKFGILTLVEKVYFVTKLLPPIQNESDKESEERTVSPIQKK